MLEDLIRISLIFLLLLSVLPIIGSFIGEIIYDEFIFSRLIIISILCITLISLAIMLCATKDFKTLLIILIISIAIMFILFAIELDYLSNFVKKHRQKLIDLIKKYPDGSQPNEWHLSIYYILIKEQKCCGIDRYIGTMSYEQTYFRENFPSNCIRFFPDSANQPLTYEGQPCINFVHDVHRLLFAITIIKIAFVIFLLILFGLYIVLSLRQQNRRVQPIVYQYPSDNNPNVLPLPAYSDPPPYDKQ